MVSPVGSLECAGSVSGIIGSRLHRRALLTSRSLKPHLDLICFSYSAAASRSIYSSVSTFSFQFILLPCPPPSIPHSSLTAAPLSPVRLERRITETLSGLSRAGYERAGGAAGPHKRTLDYLLLLQEHEASPSARRSRHVHQSVRS